MCSEKFKREKLFFIKYFLPPIIFYFLFVSQHIGTRYIVDHRCSGILRAAPSQINNSVASVARFHDGKRCIDNKYIDTDKDFAMNFGEVIGSLNSLLKFEVCFDQATSIQNEEGPAESPEEIILEDHNKIPAELRIEAESDKGFEVQTITKLYQCSSTKRHHNNLPSRPFPVYEWQYVGKWSKDNQ